jgi:5-methylcytosine-specific restriction enzyme B
MFYWIPIYAALAKKLLSYCEKQNELIELFKGVEVQGLPVGSVLDTDLNGQKIPLAEMGPFTFFGYFNRPIKDENRFKLLSQLKTSFQLAADLPTDFEGVPLVAAQNAWFFPWKYKRKPDGTRAFGTSLLLL